MRVPQLTVLTMVMVALGAPVSAQSTAPGTITGCEHTVGTDRITCEGTIGEIGALTFVAIAASEVPLSSRDSGDGPRLPTTEEIEEIVGGISLERGERDLLVGRINDFLAEEITRALDDQSLIYRDFVNTRLPLLQIATLEDFANASNLIDEAGVDLVERYVEQELQAAQIVAFDAFLDEVRPSLIAIDPLDDE